MIPTLRLIRILAAATMAAALMPAPAEAGDDNGLLRAIRLLRDRGSITVEQYEALKAAAEEKDEPADTEAAPAQPETEPDADPTPWYRRFQFRGYAQFRFSETAGGTGPALHVPTDRSVDEDETFTLRRGRAVLSGEVSDHLDLYAQADLFASTGGSEVALQLRDLYADINLDEAKAFRVRVGQSKVPYGFVNMQSSQNRAALERPDGINSAVEGERDIGAFLMWAPPGIRARFDEINEKGLKGSGDYGVATVGVYSGQGLNRGDQNGQVHVLGRVSYPFRLASGQFVELGVQAYRGRFVTEREAILFPGREPYLPLEPDGGVLDQRIGVTAVWYPQPLGVEVEWNIGEGPSLSDDFAAIEQRSLHGGYAQVSYREENGAGTWVPFARWHYFDGGRKFGTNAPRSRVNEMDFGLEFARWAEVEVTVMYTRTFERTRGNLFPYESTTDANRVGIQVQWNY